MPPPSDFRFQVIGTKGSDKEMGRQHGEQLKEAAEQGMLDFYFHLWEQIQIPRGMGKWQSWLIKNATDQITPLLRNRLEKNIPPWMLARMEGMREALGESHERVMTALVLPDLLPYLQSLWATFRPHDFVAVDLPRFGCTSFLTQGQSFFMGRNLDFPGVNYWDRYPVIQSFQPQTGLRYVGITSAGVPLAGITGINEAQIAIAVHQHYSRKANLSGELPFAIGEKILRECASLAEAEAVLEKAKISSSWAFLIADGRKGTGFLYELSPRFRGKKTFDGTPLGHSNHFQTEACRQDEYATTMRMNWDNRCRRQRLIELLEKGGRELSVAQALLALSDHWDPFWEEPKVANRTVSQVYNIQSVLFDFEKMELWAAEGPSPIHLGRYAQFSLSRILAGESGRTGVELPGYSFVEGAMGDAKRAYISSFVDAFGGNNPPALLKIKEGLASYEFAEGWLVRGILELKEGSLELGLESLQRGISLVDRKCNELQRKERPPEFFELRLYEARALDLLGRRDQATQAYSALANDVRLSDRRIRALARQAKPFTKSWLERVWMPYAAYIPFQ